MPPATQRLARFLPDVPRLLRLRDHFRELQSEDARSSVTAFLAWKAFLIVALREEEPTEKGRCKASAAATLAHCPNELISTLESFAQVMQQFLNPRVVSAAVFEEWFITVDEFRHATADELRAIAEGHRNTLRRLVPIPAVTAPRGALLSYGDHLGSTLYSVRNAVLGHASIHTTSVLFALIVPRFEDTIAELALLGRARHAGVSPTVVRDELAQLAR